MKGYTLVRCRRYIAEDIKVHCQNDAINLGLIRMLESCGAEKLLQMLEKQLADFGITNAQTSDASMVSDLLRRMVGYL